MSIERGSISALEELELMKQAYASVLAEISTEQRKWVINIVDEYLKKMDDVVKDNTIDDKSKIKKIDKTHDELVRAIAFNDAWSKRQNEDKIYRRCPTSSTTTATHNIFMGLTTKTAREIDYEATIKKINDLEPTWGILYGARREGNSLVIAYTAKGKGKRKGDLEAEIILENIDSVTGSNNIKFFYYFLMEINRQNFVGNINLHKSEIIIDLRDVMEIMGYKRIDHAKRAVQNAHNILKNITYKGIDARRKAGRENPDRSGPFLGVLEAKNCPKGTVIMEISPRINWDLLATGFTVVPNILFQKSSVNEFALGIEVASVCRRNDNDIVKKGYAYLSNKVIALRLALPVDKTMYFTRDVKKPIMEAIKDLQASCGEYWKIETDYSKTLTKDETADGKDFLKGGIRIEPQGKFLQWCKDSDAREKRAKTNTRKNIEKNKRKIREDKIKVEATKQMMLETQKANI